MDFSKYRQHPRFGVVIIQMRGLSNNEVSVLKLNGESLRANEEDLSPVSQEFKIEEYILKKSGIYSHPLSMQCKKKLAILLLTTAEEGDVKKIAEQLELQQELDEWIVNS